MLSADVETPCEYIGTNGNRDNDVAVLLLRSYYVHLMNTVCPGSAGSIPTSLKYRCAK